MIQLIGKKGTVGFDNVCVCVCEILASQGMTKTPSFPILKRGIAATIVVPVVCAEGVCSTGTPSALCFQQSCVCAVFSSASVPAPTHTPSAFLKEILPLDYVCRTSQGSIKGTMWQRVNEPELCVHSQTVGITRTQLVWARSAGCQTGPKLLMWEWETVLKHTSCFWRRRSGASAAHQQRALNTLSA